MRKNLTQRKTNFTIIPNNILINPNLSWKAKGLFAYMLSKPKYWSFNPKGDLVKRSLDNITSIYSAIKELVEQKYVSRLRDKNGNVIYHIFENPKDNDITDYLANQLNIECSELSQQTNIIQLDLEKLNQKTLFRKAHLENLNQETSIRSNTEYSNTEYSNTKHTNTHDQFSKKNIYTDKFDPASHQPKNINQALWRDWIQHRKEMNKPLTQTACIRLVKQIEAMQHAEEAIEKSIICGYTGIFETTKASASNVAQPNTINQTPNHTNSVIDHLDPWGKKAKTTFIQSKTEATL